MAQALEAIATIQQEGEGTPTSPDASPGGEDAHYYKFGAIYHGRKIKQDGTSGKWSWTGDVVSFPDKSGIWPMAEIPKGGWTNASGVPDSVIKKLATFNGAYKAVLDNLQSAWTGGQLDTGLMLSMAGPAQDLMAQSIGCGVELNYGPDFIVS